MADKTRLGSIKVEAIGCRKAWRGGKEGDWAWHYHHEVLCEPIPESPIKRIRFILSNKPLEERAIRLRCFRPVKGELPRDLIQAGETYKKTYCQAKKKLSFQTAIEFQETLQTYDQAKEAYFQECTKHQKFLENLRAKEYPNCPWDGETIFPGDVI